MLIPMIGNKYKDYQFIMTNLAFAFTADHAHFKHKQDASAKLIESRLCH